MILRKCSYLILAIVVLMLGCGSESAEEVANKVIKSLNDSEYNVAWDYVATSSKKNLQKQLEMANNNEMFRVMILSIADIDKDISKITPYELFTAILDHSKNLNGPSNTEIMNVSVNGKKAEIEFIARGKMDVSYMIKEDDGWKLILN